MDGALAHINMQQTILSMPKPAKLTCLAKFLKGLYIGYPKLGHHTRSKVFRFSFYKETIARLLTLEQNRNLIETQEVGHGVTCYSDHLPGIKNASLSNKGKLSTWRIHETSDLTSTSIVETLYKSGPTMAIADPLSRLARQEHQLDNLDLPLMLEMLLKELPSSVRNALIIRVNAEKDTIVATRIVQRWRKPSNPISNTVGSISDKIDFLISAPYADKTTVKGS
jgi:hypothetical protein